MMTMHAQPATTPSLFPPRLTPSLWDLLRALQGRGWVRRAHLATELHTTIRQVRDAAQHSHGQILSGPHGLMLTVEATSAEKGAALGRFRSQIRHMTLRIQQTEQVWHAGGR